MIILKESSQTDDMMWHETEPLRDEAPISVDKVELPDGRYDALWYGYTMEVVDRNSEPISNILPNNAVTFKTRIGVKCSREYCGKPRRIIVKNGQAWLAL
jgi:hypothetical protein